MYMGKRECVSAYCLNVKPSYIIAKHLDRIVVTVTPISYDFGLKGHPLQMDSSVTLKILPR